MTIRLPSGGDRGGYGWQPDLPDIRDFLFEPSGDALGQIATVQELDLSTDPAMPKVWDQGQLGSCTAHTVGASFEFAHKKSGHRGMTPCRLWIYYQERVLEGTVGEDAGAMIRDGFKVCANIGVPIEADWPYDISTFRGPPPHAATAGVKHKDIAYKSIQQNSNALKAALISGFPVSFGFTVYESFESQEVADTGIVPMPQPHEAVLGGHAVLLVGFDNAKQAFKCRNSWSVDWGEAGYFWLPFEYVLNPQLASDFWQATLAS
jgi:C1A family cysteine protease